MKTTKNLRDEIQEDHTLRAAVEALRQEASKEKESTKAKAPKGKKAKKDPTNKVKAIKAETTPRPRFSTWTLIGAIIGVIAVLFVLFGGKRAKKFTEILYRILGRHIDFRIAFGAIGVHGGFDPKTKNWHIYGGRKNH